MKTRNNVQKTVLRFAAVVISLVLISFTVSAQDFWKKLITSSGFNEIALAMVDHTNYVSHNEGLSYSNLDRMLANETEDELTIEPWMLDKNLFGENVSINSIEKEDQLKIEPWMLNEELFNVINTNERLKLEDWMISKSVWK